MHALNNWRCSGGISRLQAAPSPTSRFERLTYFKPPALPGVSDFRCNKQTKSFDAGFTVILPVRYKVFMNHGHDDQNFRSEEV